MMRTSISTLLLLTSIASGAASTAFSRSASNVARSTLFGISRGGALFGGNKDKKEEANATEKVMYPAMSKEEVEEWLQNVPVFAVTDSKGAGVVLKPDSEQSVFYFFMSPQMANATLHQLKESGASENMDLRVSAFSLGKIWFRILNADEPQGVTLKSPGDGEEEVTSKVEYRLVPDTRDLLGARMLLTMNPEDGEKLKAGEQMTPEIAQAAIKKAMTESPKFNSTYNEIPVFMIAQMRMQKQPAEGEGGEPVTLLPMYFGLQDMVSTWQQFMSQAPADLQGVEPSINLLSLHDLVARMQKESEIDFRNVVLVPSLTMGADPDEAAQAAQAEAADPMAQMGGSTLGDL